jgi:hypothetical protein
MSLSEIYHPDTEDSEEAMVRRRVVILTKSVEDESSNLLERANAYMENRDNTGKVFVLNGSPMEENDLVHRARAGEADAMFILSNSFSQNPSEDDTANIFRALAVQEYVPFLPLYISLHDATCKSLLPPRLVERSCIFTRQTQMEVLAISSLVPAFSTLLYSLCRTSRSVQDPRNAINPILTQFLGGVDYEFYVLQVSPNLHGSTLRDLVSDFFLSFNITLVGFCCSTCERVTFDLDAKVTQNSKLLIIAPDRTVAAGALSSGLVEFAYGETHPSGKCEHMVPRHNSPEPMTLGLSEAQEQLTMLPPNLELSNHILLI